MFRKTYVSVKVSCMPNTILEHSLYSVLQTDSGLISYFTFTVPSLVVYEML
jgi:hypothetical protein